VERSQHGQSRAKECDEDLASILVVVVSASGQAVVAAPAEAMRARRRDGQPVDGDELLRVVDTHCRPTLP
jgi:hypothetical protein